MYNQVLTEKNDLLAQELEKCRTQLTAITAELEKSKKASSGNIPLHREIIMVYQLVLILFLILIGSSNQLEVKLKAAQTGKKEAKRLHAAGERVLTRVREAKTTCRIKTSSWARN